MFTNYNIGLNLTKMSKSYFTPTSKEKGEIYIT